MWDLFDVCRELNARCSVLSRVLELSGAPIAVLENVDGSEGIAVGPGAKWELPEGAKAYLLDLLASGGVGLHFDYVQLLYRALHDLSETPRTAFGDAGRDVVQHGQPFVEPVQFQQGPAKADLGGIMIRLLAKRGPVGFFGLFKLAAGFLSAGFLDQQIGFGGH